MGWNVWSIKQQKYKKVEDFLSSLSEVESFIYPLLEKDIMTKKGKKTRGVPLYGNYIFLKYNHTDDVAYLISKCKWINSYIGPCSEKEIKEIYRVNGMCYTDIIPNDYGLKPGMMVQLKNSNFSVCVKDVVGERVIVSITLFGIENELEYNIDDIALEG